MREVLEYFIIIQTAVQLPLTNVWSVYVYVTCLIVCSYHIPGRPGVFYDAFPSFWNILEYLFLRSNIHHLGTT